MKVSDVMFKSVDYVSVDTPIKEVCRLIFGGHINGVPVVKDKRVVGFITEQDILKKFYPSMREFMEDSWHTRDFEAMEEQVQEIYSLTAKDVMNKYPKTITPDTPLLRAQSYMFVNHVGRVPVVDKNNKLVGIITQGDIFRVLVGDKLPYLEDEEYHDWLSHHYDYVIKWNERLPKEINELDAIFSKLKVKRIIDILAGTGEHSIALAQKGYQVIGLESSNQMYKSVQYKLQKLPPVISDKITFLKG